MQIPAARILFTDNDKDAIAQHITAAVGTGALTLGANTCEFRICLRGRSRGSVRGCREQWNGGV